MFSTDLPCSKDPDLFISTREFKQEKARSICVRCTEQPNCLEQAMEFRRISGEQLQGMVAGFLPDEREKIYRRRAA